MATHLGVVVSESGADGTTGSEPGPVGTGHAWRAPDETPSNRTPVGDLASFGDLYLGSYEAMVRLARVLVASPETAEDLVQDAFVHLHRHWGGVRDPRAYLHRSVVNACRSHHRRAWRERPRGSRPDAEARPGETAGFADRAVPVVDGVVEQGRSDDAEVLGAALAGLPYRQRAALVLRYYADLPDAEIAVALACRPGTVASLVHRGLERLREVVDHD
jgi:RNA polymerase sigma factor (sigma-70 family)